MDVSALRQDPGTGEHRYDSGEWLSLRCSAGVRIIADLPPQSQVVPAIDDCTPSIAFLPFVNLSDDAANEYFGGAQQSTTSLYQRYKVWGLVWRLDSQCL